jgi:hypothetical protein
MSTLTMPNLSSSTSSDTKSARLTGLDQHKLTCFQTCSNLYALLTFFWTKQKFCWIKLWTEKIFFYHLEWWYCLVVLVKYSSMQRIVNYSLSRLEKGAQNKRFTSIYLSFELNGEIITHRKSIISKEQTMVDLGF